MLALPLTKPSAPSGGGAAIAIPRTVFVSASIGNNATAEVGNPAKPYATAQAAYNAWLTLTVPGRLHVMDGNVGGIALTADMPNDLHITGAGPWCELGGVSANGVSPPPADPGSNGLDGGYGWAIRITSDWSVNLGNVTGYGGTGSDAGVYVDGDLTGGHGGASSVTKLYHVLCDNIEIGAGVGGDGNDPLSSSSVGGNGGNMGDVVLIGVRAFSLYMASSSGGNGGGSSGTPGTVPTNTTVIGCIFDDSMTVLGLAGVVANNVAYNLSVSGGVTEYNSVPIGVAPAWP